MWIELHEIKHLRAHWASGWTEMRVREILYCNQQNGESKVLYTYSVQYDLSFDQKRNKLDLDKINYIHEKLRACMTDSWRDGRDSTMLRKIGAPKTENMDNPVFRVAQSFHTRKCDTQWPGPKTEAFKSRLRLLGTVSPCPVYGMSWDLTDYHDMTSSKTR